MFRVTPGSVFPLRAMTQDELFSAAVAVVRRNPRATLGLPFLSGLIGIAVTVLALLLFPSPAYLRMITDPAAFEDLELAAAAFSDISLLLIMMLNAVLTGLLGFTALGLLAIPTLRSALGLPTTLWQAVRLRASRIGWLILHLALVFMGLAIVFGLLIVVASILAGLTMFIGLIVILPCLFLLLCVVTAALMFGPAAIMVEGHNAFSAVGRSIQLNRGLWWRHIGLLALFYLVITGAIVVASTPVGLLVSFGGELAWTAAPENQDRWAMLLLVGSQLFDLILNTLIIALSGTLASVMYLNIRFRREALDVVLSTANTDDDAATLLPGSPEHLQKLRLGGTAGGTPSTGGAGPAPAPPSGARR